MINPTHDDVGRAVIYIAHDGHRERGVITSISGSYVFVRYALSGPGIATRRDQLEWEHPQHV